LVFTTLAPAVLSAQTIMALYRCRWQVVALHLTVVKLTCNKNGVPTYSSWHASTQSQEDHHGPHNHILPP
jgi:hypothetical protein